MTTPTATELLMQVGDEARSLRESDPERALTVAEVDDLLCALAQRLADALAEVEQVTAQLWNEVEAATRIRTQRDEARAQLAELQQMYPDLMRSYFDTKKP
jgi:hypothetical protein